jgi:hypothetical protein
MFTGLLEAAMPVCQTPQERLFLQHVILDRVVVYRPGRGYIYEPENDPEAGGMLIAECLERLTHEGNMHLLGPEEIPAILQTEFRLANQLGSSAATAPAAPTPAPARAPVRQPRLPAAAVQALDGVKFSACPAAVPPGPRGAAITLSWDARASGVDAVKIFVKARTGEEELFAHALGVGSQETGP